MLKIDVRIKKLENRIEKIPTSNVQCLSSTGPVDSLVKSGAKVGISRGFKHSVVFTDFLAVSKLVLCAQFVRAFCSFLCSGVRRDSNQLGLMFSTQSTAPITEATNLTKYLIMETA